MNPQEDIDFEISFYESLLDKNPEFVNALVALGDAYTRKGRYKDGLEIDRRLVKLRPDDPIVYYNLACSYSLLKVPDDCLGALKKAIHLGYHDFSFMDKDPDLEFIKKDPRYKEIVSEYRNKTA
jgi:tetratricopeptide (TPR) repeat protein